MVPPCLFAALQKHLVEFACFFSFLVEAYYGFYGVASAFESTFRYPAVDFLKRFLRQPELNLSQQTTVNNTVYNTLKHYSEELQCKGNSVWGESSLVYALDNSTIGISVEDASERNEVKF